MVGPAIVIDNGSYECRAGFSNKKEPSMVFRNVVMKSRSRQRDIFVGDVGEDFDFNQMNTKTAFEQNIVTQIDIQEIVFDYIFSKLGIHTSGINHPVILSEALLCPQNCRSHETIAVSCGYQTTHIIPFAGDTSLLNISSACRRVGVGGAHISWGMQQLLSLKYPCHVEKFTMPAIDFGKVSLNYREEMEHWKDDAYINDNSTVWELPYNDESQRRADELAERRQMQAERLREMHKKRAIERLKEGEKQFDSEESECTQDYRSEDVKRDYYGDSESIYDSDGTIATSQGDHDSSRTQKKRQRINLREKKATELMASLALPAAIQAQMTSATVGGNQGLTDIKMRRRVLAAKDLEARRGEDFCLWLSKVNNKRQRIAKQRTLRQSKVDLATELGLHSQGGPDDQAATSGLVANKQEAPSFFALGTNGPVSERRQRQLEKIRAMAAELKPERTTTNATGKRGAKGGKTKAFSRKESNKNLTDMAGDDGDSPYLLLEDDDDNEAGIDSLDVFPDNDEDGEDASLSFAKRQRQHPLPESPHALLPGYSDTHNHGQQQQKSRFKDAFDRLEEEGDDLSECERDQLAVLDSVRAFYDPEFLKETGTADLKVDISDYYKIHLTTEPIRAAEALFERGLIGSSQAGIGECLSWVLRDSSKTLYGDASQTWEPKCLFITGGPAKLPGLKERLQLELQQILPWREGGNAFQVVVAADPSLDAWRGAQSWCRKAAEDNYQSFTTRNEYEECGLDYLKENAISNRFYASFKDMELNPKSATGRGRQSNVPPPNVSLEG